MSVTGHFIGCFPKYLLESHKNIKKCAFWRVRAFPLEAKCSIFFTHPVGLAYHCRRHTGGHIGKRRKRRRGEVVGG